MGEWVGGWVGEGQWVGGWVGGGRRYLEVGAGGVWGPGLVAREHLALPFQVLVRAGGGGFVSVGEGAAPAEEGRGEAGHRRRKGWHDGLVGCWGPLYGGIGG